MEGKGVELETLKRQAAAHGKLRQMATQCEVLASDLEGQEFSMSAQVLRNAALEFRKQAQTMEAGIAETCFAIAS